MSTDNRLETFVTSWRTVALSLIPGMLAMVGLVGNDFSAYHFVGIGILVAFVIVAWVWNNQQLPWWSLMASGFLTGAGLSTALSVLGAILSVVTHTTVDPSSWLFLSLPWVVMLFVITFSLRGQHISGQVWILMALVVVCNILVRVKNFILVDVSWSVAHGVISVGLWAAALALLPVVIGIPLARRHGKFAILFVVGSTYMAFQSLINVDQQVRVNFNSSTGFIAYMVLIPLLFTIIAPLWYLRTGPMRAKMGGLLTLTGVAVAANIIVSGWVRGDFTLIIWLSAIPYIISVLLTIALAHFLYRGARAPNTRFCTQPENYRL